MILALLAACTPAAPTWSADVAPLLAESCAGCHVSGGIAPFPLTTWEEAAAHADAIAASTAARTMPPWQAAPGCTDYAGDLSLSDDALATLAAWAAADAPEGDPGITAVAPATSAIDRVDAVLSMAEPYTPSLAGDDDYRCFLLDWPEADPSYVTGFTVQPGNATVVHHVLAYVAAPEDVATFEALDAAEDGPGYSCFGGPGGDDPLGAALIGGWAPGGVGSAFPEGTGIPVAAGSKLVLQLHYNLANVASPDEAVDQSSISVRLESAVDSPARILPFTDPTWVAGNGMVIAAGAQDVSYRFDMPVPAGTNGLLWSANLHMHQLGRGGTLSVAHADGSESCLLTIEDWDFHWQRSYAFAEPVPVTEGDQLGIECHWDNPTDSDVAWGEGTADEMCVGFFYATAG